jgi:hypothetical protein
MPNEFKYTGPGDKRSLYEPDYYTGALKHARPLKEHQLEALDWENLADELMC